MISLGTCWFSAVWARFLFGEAEQRCQGYRSTKLYLGSLCVLADLDQAGDTETGLLLSAETTGHIDFRL